MEQQTINGGVQFVAQLAPKQLIYLDFDGELTSYNGEILNVDEVAVENSQFSAERIATITAALNEQFADQNVLFVSDKSDLSDTFDYSTIYIGKTTAFEPYGNFSGLAETVDSGNRIKNDNAFVMLDSTTDNAQIIETIAHEAGHLLGTLEHGGEKLERYGYTNYYNLAYTGVLTSSLSLTHYSTSVYTSGSKLPAYYFYDRTSGAIIDSTGSLHIGSDCYAANVTVKSNGYISGEFGYFRHRGDDIDIKFISGTALEHIAGLNGIGIFSVSGTAENVTLSSGASWGSMTLLNGAVGNSVTLNMADLSIRNGATVNNTVVNDGKIHIDSGCTANNTIVNSGYMYVYGSGTASNTIVSAGGSMEILSGGYADGAAIAGRVYISGGSVANMTLTSGGSVYCLDGKLRHYGSNDCFVGGISSGIVSNISNFAGYGSFSVAGSVDDIALTLLSGNRGSMVLLSGAVADGITLDYSDLYIADGAVANNINLSSYGHAVVAAGAAANRATVSYFSELHIYSGGLASGITINSNGRMYVSSGGYASNTTLSRGSFLQGTFGTLAHLGESACSVGCISDNGVSDISNFTGYNQFAVMGNADHIVLTHNSGHQGNMTLLSGAEANDVILNYANLSIEGGAVANDISVNNHGGIGVASGAAVNRATVSDYSELHIYSGGTASNTSINSHGRMYISSGGYAGETTVDGEVCVSSGGSAANMTLISGSWVYGFGGTLRHYGSSRCFVGGISDGIVSNISNFAGYGSFSAAGNVDDIALTHLSGNRGSIILQNGAVAHNIALDFSDLSIESGAVANDIDVDYGYVGVAAGAAANRAAVCNCGALHIFSGGIATWTSVNSNGRMHISAGGYAVNTSVNRGDVYVSSGGVLAGSIQIAGGNVTVWQGAIIDFTVAEQETPSTALINNWSLIYRRTEASYTITVNCDQDDGVYTLAEGAAGFDSVITVKTADDTKLGTLSVGEEKVFGTSTYTLEKTEGLLSLSIVSNAKPARSDVDGNNVSDVVFQYTGGDYQIGFWMNGTNAWQGQGVGQPSNWELLGAYDMDQNGKADIVMRGNIQIGADKGAYIGYYKDGDVTNWQNISFLNNSTDIDWKLAIGNITGNAGANSLVWHAPDLGALGVWTDGTANWVSLAGGFDRNWTMLGCGDFDGNGKDEVLFSNNGNLYTTDIDQNFASLGGWGADWNVKAIGDFSGDGKDDLILQNGNMVVKFVDGKAENWSAIGVMDASDWFIVGAGDYNGDEADDLLVRQYSTGMLGYYANGDMSQWVEMGRGVDMNWSVIA